MCSGSEAGSCLRLIDFVHHSTLDLRVIKKKKKRIIVPSKLSVPQTRPTNTRTSRLLTGLDTSNQDETQHGHDECQTKLCLAKNRGTLQRAGRVIPENPLMSQHSGEYWAGHPHGGVRPRHQKSTCVTQSTLGPNVVKLWSRNPPDLEGTKLTHSFGGNETLERNPRGNETLALHRVGIRTSVEPSSLEPDEAVRPAATILDKFGASSS